MVRQLHLTGIARQTRSLSGRNVEEHLLGVRRDHEHWTIAHFHQGPFGMRLAFRCGTACWWKARRAMCDDGFQSLDVILVRSPANVTRTVVVVIGKYATDLAVQLNPRRPIALMLFLRSIVIDPGKRRLLASQVNGFFNVV